MSQKKLIKGVLKKIKEFESSDPFFARMTIEIFKIRDFVYLDEVSRKDFDKHYQYVLDNLSEAKDAKDRCKYLIKQHSKKISQGNITCYKNGNLRIDESIDEELNKNFKDFFIKGEMALQALNKLSKFMNNEINFFFKSKDKFNKESKRYLAKYQEKKHKEYIKFLNQNRKKWYEAFNDMRNEIEHRGFKLPNIQYTFDKDDKTIAIFPKIQSKPLSTFIENIWVNIFIFIEEIIIYFFRCKILPPASIECIPEKFRDKDFPVKYRLTVDLSTILKK